LPGERKFRQDGRKNRQGERKISRAEDFFSLFFLSPGKAEDFLGKAEEKNGKFFEETRRRSAQIINPCPNPKPKPHPASLRHPMEAPKRTTFAPPLRPPQLPDRTAPNTDFALEVRARTRNSKPTSPSILARGAEPCTPPDSWNDQPRSSRSKERALLG